MTRYLHLADGTTFSGLSIGSPKESYGEVVFSTGMVGYPQSLTDPSFAGQILVCTYPLIGNYGIPKKKRFTNDILANFESNTIWVKGVVVSESVDKPSHRDSAVNFSDWLFHEHIPGIAGIDTRLLTQKIREYGVMLGVISHHSKPPTTWHKQNVSLVPTVSTKKILKYSARSSGAKHVVLIDCGVKHGILRALISCGYRVTRIPWNADPLSIAHVDAIVCSNGPGDPKDVPETIEHIGHVVQAGIPFLGICLGHQLLALSIGADTYKLPYGHRGLNQPCMDMDSERAYLTSQNHGYAVRASTLPNNFTVWFTNLNDGTNEGLRHKTKPVRSIQFHPEGNPGPYDTYHVFQNL